MPAVRHLERSRCVGGPIHCRQLRTSVPTTALWTSIVGAQVELGQQTGTGAPEEKQGEILDLDPAGPGQCSSDVKQRDTLDFCN
ncbi:hypothetical protein Tco_0456067 [Tanacetum coccineum]